MRQEWTISGLSDESGMDRRTLVRVLADVAPIRKDDKSDFFTLAQVFAALEAYWKPESEDAGDLVREQARLTKIKADIAQVDRARIRKEVITTAEVKEIWRNIGFAIRRTILTCGMTEKEKDHCLNEINSFNVEQLIAAGELGATENDTDLEHKAE